MSVLGKRYRFRWLAWEQLHHLIAEQKSDKVKKNRPEVTGSVITKMFPIWLKSEGTHENIDPGR